MFRSAFFIVEKDYYFSGSGLPCSLSRIHRRWQETSLFLVQVEPPIPRAFFPFDSGMQAFLAKAPEAEE